MSLVRQVKWQYLLLGIIVIYFLLRLPSLTTQPIFADEAIYIRWAQIAKAEPSLRFISLQDGKTPLFMWVMAPFLMIFENPLLAGRLLSILAGFFTLLGVFSIGKKHFNLMVGLVAALLVAITPFMIFFDRMALVDSMLAAFTVWVIYWALELAHHQSLKKAVILGLLLGAGWLTKTPGMVNLILLPVLLLFFDFKKKRRSQRLVKFASYFALATLIALALYLLQKVDPNFHQLSARNSDYIHPWSRLLQYPVDPLIPHLKDTAYFTLPFLGPLLLVFPIVFFYSFWGKNKFAIMILLWSLIPFVYELQFIKAYTARYILYSLPPFLILVAAVLTFPFLKDSRGYFLKLLPILKFFSWMIFLAAIFWCFSFTYPLLTNLAHLPIAREERRGYFEDWTAGYGLEEIAHYLIRQSQSQTIVVGTEGSFGTLPDGVLIYLDRYFHQSVDQKIIVLGDGSKVTETVRNYSSEKPTFFIANKSRYALPEPGLELIREYPKLTGPDLPPDAILFYKVLPIR